MNQEKTLEEKLRELSLDDLNKITYQKIVLSASIKDTMQRPDVKAKWDETKAKISAANKGKVISDETKAKISAAGKGRVMSDETRDKISKAHKGHHRCLGYKHTDETKAKMSAGNTGKIRSAETKAKLSVINKGKVISDETKAKISAGQKASLSTSKVSKVTEAQVLEIRSKYVPRKYTFRMLGKEYGLEAQAVMRIINRKTWNHI